MCVVRVSVLWARQDSNLRPRDPNEAAARSKGSRAAAASRRQQPRQHPPRQIGCCPVDRAAAGPAERMLPGCWGSNRPEPRRMLPFGRADAAIRPGGCRQIAGQHPPRQGGCCPATEADAARRQGSIRLGRADAARQPGSSRRTTLGCCTTLVRMLPSPYPRPSLDEQRGDDFTCARTALSVLERDARVRARESHVRTLHARRPPRGRA